RIRPPSVRCTWWNAMSRCWVAEYSFTGIVTSPNEIAPFQMLRIRLPPALSRSPRWAGTRESRGDAGRGGDMRERVSVTVEGRELTLSNLDKVLYPESGFTKAEVIDYYTRIAPVLLPHLAGRPLTVKRYPDGVAGQSFYEKNTRGHTPAWVRRVTLPVPGSTKDRETIDFAVVDDLPTLIYFANLAAIELHVPMWRVDR